MNTCPSSLGIARLCSITRDNSLVLPVAQLNLLPYQILPYLDELCTKGGDTVKLFALMEILLYVGRNLYSFLIYRV